jgi:hypothetical protein
MRTEERLLIYRILASQELRQAGLSGDLLVYFAEHSEERVTAKQIMLDLYRDEVPKDRTEDRTRTRVNAPAGKLTQQQKSEEELRKKKEAEEDKEDDKQRKKLWERVRKEIESLREKLKDYFNTHTEPLTCYITTFHNDGYQLQFNRLLPRSASEVFWEAHLERVEDVLVVCGDHLFFFDRAEKKIFRFYGFNVDKSTTAQTIVESLKERYPSSYNPGIVPSHRFYFAMGEVEAYECLLRWFHEHSGGRLIRKCTTSREIVSLNDFSPILFGRPVTNEFLANYMKSTAATGHLAYRIDDDFNVVRIKPSPDSETNEKEKEELARFGFTPGVLTPVLTSGVLKPPDLGLSFGILSRIPHPSGHGVMTMVSFHYYSKVTARVMDALTNDKSVEAIFKKMRWSLEKELPKSFEMLFAVKINPADLDGEGKADFLCWRKYELT